MEKLLNLKEAMEYLHVSKSTMHRWDREKMLVAVRTSGGHRRYRKSDLDKMAGLYESENVDSNSNLKRAVIYSRCSTTEQKTRGDIDRQS